MADIEADLVRRVDVQSDINESIKSIWTESIRQLTNQGPPANLTPHNLAGLYAVTSITYYGNDHPLISDNVYDGLCRWLAHNYDTCVAAGADMLDLEMLQNCSGYEVKSFVKPYHEIASVLIGRDCECIFCQNQ